MFFNDFGDILCLYAAVKGSFRINDHDGTQSAKTETTGRNDFDFVGKTVFGKLFDELVLDGSAAGRCAAGTGADQNM